jgi:hypothetical protein
MRTQTKIFFFGRKVRLSKLNGKSASEFINGSEEILETEAESDADLEEGEVC